MNPYRPNFVRGGRINCCSWTKEALIFDMQQPGCNSKVLAKREPSTTTLQRTLGVHVTLAAPDSWRAKGGGNRVLADTQYVSQKTS